MGDLDIQFKSFFSLKKGMIKMIEGYIEGYKAFDNNFKCLGKQYEPNKLFVEDGNIELCEQGMHFCENPLDIFRYKRVIPIRTRSELLRFAKVQAKGKVIGGENKICTDVLKIKDEIDYFELIHDIFKMNQKRNYYEGYYIKCYGFILENGIHAGLLFNYGEDQKDNINLYYNLYCIDSTIINGISNRNNQLNNSYYNDIINYADNVTFSFFRAYGNNIVIFGQNNTICLNDCNENNIIILGEHNNIYINDTFKTNIVIGKNNHIRVNHNDTLTYMRNTNEINYDELLKLTIKYKECSLYGTIKRRYDMYGKFFKK